MKTQVVQVVVLQLLQEIRQTINLKFSLIILQAEMILILDLILL